MKFESMLARRYIFSQKRHSLLTICSIIIALALMVMLSSTFSTVLGIMRDYSYEIEPYHVMFEDVTKEQAAEIRHMNQVASVEIIENKGMGNSYQAQVMFSTYIDDDTAFFQNMIDHIGLNASYSPFGAPQGFRINQNLMTYDQIDLKGKYEMTCTVAVFAMYLLLFAFALRLVIDTAFEVSSKERERQFGVLQSVGATPKQIVRIMTVEGMYLSLVGVPLGIGLGLLLSFAAYKMILATGIAEAFMTSAQIGKVVHFHIKPLLTAFAGIVGIGWVFFSAYGTGMRVIRMTPVQAITARAKTVTKVKKHTLLSLFFGWKGKVASRNARRSRKHFAITVLSLTISMLLFATVSSLITMAEQILTEMMQYEDDLGTIKSDFEMWVDMKPDAVMQSPEDVAEGIKMLEDSGYFTNIQHNVSLIGGIHAENTKQSNENFLIYYVNRADYQRVAEKTDISYDELTASGGALMCGNRYALEKYQTDELKVDIQNYHEITREEYDKRYEKGLEILNEEKKEQLDDAEIFRYQAEMRGNCHHISQNRFDSENMENAVFYEILDETVTYPIIGTIDQYTEDEYAEMEAAGTLDTLKQDRIHYILLTEDTWRSGDWEKFGIRKKYWMSNINCQLAHDEDYEAAKAFLKDHSEIFGIFEGSEDMMYEEALDHFIYDMYTPNKQNRTVLSAVHIGLMFLLVMVALIAVVNMVNIVSTGILNRKREFAAMQCSGMTRGQMYGIAAIECLQFALWAAIAASLLCGLLLFGTNAFMRVMEVSMKTKELMFLLSTPFIRIWIAAAVAFICAFAASVIPLRTMQKESLVEQIRAVE